MGLLHDSPFGLRCFTVTDEYMFFFYPKLAVGRGLVVYGSSYVVDYLFFTIGGSLLLSAEVTSLRPDLSTLLQVSTGGSRCGEDHKVIAGFGGSVSDATTIRHDRCTAFSKNLDNIIRMRNNCDGRVFIAPGATNATCMFFSNTQSSTVLILEAEVVTSMLCRAFQEGTFEQYE